MLNSIIRFSVRNKLIIILFIFGWIAYGLYQATKLPIDAVPDITNNQIQVITLAGSYGAADIERLVTYPIEQANSNISGLKEIRSFSRFGLSLVTIVFNDNVDVYWARQQVQERLQQVRSLIPQDIGQPEMGPISTGLGEIYQYMVRPKIGYEHRYDATELRTIQDWVVRRQLLGVPGVADVSSFGGKLKQYEVAITPGKLQAYNLTISDVFDALAKNNQNTGGAYIERQHTNLFIRSEGLINTIEDIQQIAVKALPDGTPVYIRDVADVRIGHALRYGAMTYNDKGEVAGAVVMMLKGANSSEVIKNVKERIEEIQKRLPEGVKIEPFLDRSKMVNNAISTVEKNLVEGALIVIFILVLFLGNLRAGFIVASVIPLSMLFAIIMMNMFGVSGNLMSLGALDFGLIVDGAVIIVEAVMHHISHSKRLGHIKVMDQEKMNNVVIDSAGKMMNSAVFGQIIILVVYLPIFTLQGIEGKMFKPMAQTVAFALLGAFILSVTYIPMMTSLMLSKKLQHKKSTVDKVMEKMEDLYRWALAHTMRWAKVVVTAMVVVFFLSIYLMTKLGGEFIPALEEGDFAVDTRVLPGSSLQTTIEFTQKAAHILKSRFPEVEKVVTKIGSGEIPTDPMPMEASDMMVIMKDKKEWKTAKTFNEMADTMGRALAEVPGITAGFQYPVQMRFNELMTGARQDVVCKIFGENLDSLVNYAHQLGGIIGTINGAKNVYVESVTGSPQIIVSYNRAALAQYRLNVEEVNRTINAAFAGQSAGLLYEGEKRFDIMVRLPHEAKQSPEDVKNLLIASPTGVQVPLYQLGEVGIKPGPLQIQREDAKRRIIVGFNVRGRDVESIVHELQDKVNQKIKFAPNYYVTYGGAFENLNAAKGRLGIAVPVALLLIFLLLYFAFKSVPQALMIFTAVPLSAVGGIIALWLRDMPFSISAGIGFIALFGVAVLNGIVLISEFNRLKKSGMKNLTRVVINGCGARLRPVLMTAYVAALGFLPMAISNGAGAEVQRPLATVVIGGLILATVLTLYVLPIIYITFERYQMKKIKPTKGGVAAMVLLFLPFVVMAQQPINMNEAVRIGLQQNIALQQQSKEADARKKLIGSTKEIAPMNIFGEAGQMNSNLFDTKIGVQQSILSPKYYAAQKLLAQQEYELAKAQQGLSQRDIAKAIRKAYVEYQYRLAMYMVTRQADSLMESTMKRFETRAKAGEDNRLDFATAAAQYHRIHLQMQEQWQSVNHALNIFQLWMHSPNYRPLDEKLLTELSVMQSDSATNPTLNVLAQQKKYWQAQQQLEKAKLAPSFNLGYYNSSFNGTIYQGKTYNAGNRFHVGTVGINVPFFKNAQRQRMAAYGLQAEAVDKGIEAQQYQLQTNHQLWMKLVSQTDSLLGYYQSQNMKEATDMLRLAGRQLNAGEINYIQWSTTVREAFAVKEFEIELLRKKQDALVEAIYYSNN